jgi:hypothetical protein
MFLPSEATDDPDDNLLELEFSDADSEATEYAWNGPPPSELISLMDHGPADENPPGDDPSDDYTDEHGSPLQPEDEPHGSPEQPVVPPTPPFPQDALRPLWQELLGIDHEPRWWQYWWMRGSNENFHQQDAAIRDFRGNSKHCREATALL